jgi:hypothetical protein
MGGMLRLPSVPGEPHLPRRPTVTVVLVALLGTLFMALVVAPWLAEPLASLSDLEALGASILLGSSVRVLAGIYGARAYRRAFGTRWRHEPVLSVCVGMIISWVVFTVLVLLASALSVGTWSWLVLLELPRWLVEGLLGMYLVQPGEREDDRVVDRLSRRGVAL